MMSDSESSDLKEIYKDLPGRDMWIHEALFGYTHIEPYLRKIKDGAEVLEIGSGSGILLSLVKEKFPDLSVSGLEPYSDGFDQLKIYHEKMAEKGIHIDPCGYEDFKSDKKYDFIFLINVFEHLPDWRDFLDFVKRNLSDQGACVILCPNYGFPYESHFKLPVIWNKNLTHKVFQKKISNFEEAHDCHDLWQSLNFVKMSQVRKAVKEKDIQMTIDNSIIHSMVDRLEQDPEFMKRQRAISFLAKTVKKLGLLKLFDIPFFQNMSPYMKLQLKL